MAHMPLACSVQAPTAYPNPNPNANENANPNPNPNPNPDPDPDPNPNPNQAPTALAGAAELRPSRFAPFARR